MIKLPSKRVLSVFIIAAALVAAIIIAFGRDKASTAINYASNLVAGDKISIPQNPDWQAELEKLAAEATPPTENGLPEEETVTDTVARSLIANYLALKQAGSLDSDSAQKLIDQTIEYMEKSGRAEIEMPVLNVIPDNGKQSIADYGERLGTIAQAKKPADLQKEINTVLQVMQSTDPSKIAEVDPIIASYRQIGDELAEMPVPQTFVKAHTDIAKGALGIALALEDIKNLSQDPLRGIAALQLYQESISLFLQATQATISFIIKNEIVYKQGSGGYYLLYGI